MLGGDLAVLGALGWVGRGVWAGLGADLAFCVWRAGLGWAWDLAVLGGRLGVGFGSGGRAGLGWARIRLFVYGLHRTCLLHVFMVSLCLCSCESQMCIMGLEQNKAWHW